MFLGFRVGDAVILAGNLPINKEPRFNNLCLLAIAIQMLTSLFALVETYMRFCGRVLSVFLFLLLVIGLLSAEGTGSSVGADSSFEALEHWRQAVLAGDSAALQAMYSTQPPVIIKGSITESQGPDEELKFWKERKEAGLTSLTFDDLEVKPGQNKKNEQVIFQAVITSTPATGTPRTWYLRAAQYWQGRQSGRLIEQVGRGQLTRLGDPR